MKLFWRSRHRGGVWNPFTDEMSVGRSYADKGWAPAAIAHELAHRQEGIIPLQGEPPEKVFWKELATWEAAIDRGLPLEEINEELIEDSLGGYLEDVGFEYGLNSEEHRFAKEGYERFKRRYLGGKGV